MEAVMKTSELTGAALDWAVAKCEELEGVDYEFSPTTDWLQGGPIIEREVIDVWSTGIKNWGAANGHRTGSGPTPLIAAMRCFVLSKLGEEVEIPEELK
jgi:hypothetical protein